ncbi:hypothetical protein K470DRAFT_34657 [Piedraia hortae CBS 480.64]|uniref:Uncharacterized protein n=1 Tax=Piedraia hortae CBS 480.64 TaxID=1314780 RepID=A0A6A7C335_9PEZI|nr:hypothetical protein K470DRAFT_34657 [Piedraia hortae CBS 480.64]
MWFTTQPAEWHIRTQNPHRASTNFQPLESLLGGRKPLSSFPPTVGVGCGGLQSNGERHPVFPFGHGLTCPRCRLMWRDNTGMRKGAAFIVYCCVGGRLLGGWLWDGVRITRGVE